MVELLGLLAAAVGFWGNRKYLLALRARRKNRARWKALNQNLLSGSALSKASLKALLTLASQELRVDSAQLVVVDENGAYSVADGVSAAGSLSELASAQEKNLVIEYAGVTAWRCHRDYIEHDFEHFIGVPLRLDGGQRGCLGLYGRSPRIESLSEQEAVFLATLAFWATAFAARHLSGGLDADMETALTDFSRADSGTAIQIEAA